MELAAEELDEWWDSAMVSKKKSESSHCKAIDDSDLFFCLAVVGIFRRREIFHIMYVRVFTFIYVYLGIFCFNSRLTC